MVVIQFGLIIITNFTLECGKANSAEHDQSAHMLVCTGPICRVSCREQVMCYLL
jgi:hypothetical protein